MQTVRVDDSIDIAGHTFSALLPATQCEGCDEVLIQGDDVARFELRVAAELATGGTRNAESFRFLRKALEMQPGQLAELLDIPEDYVTLWENGQWPVDPRAFAVLGSLVLSACGLRERPLDYVGVLKASRALAKQVRVDLGNDEATAHLQRSWGYAPDAMLEA